MFALGEDEIVSWVRKIPGLSTWSLLHLCRNDKASSLSSITEEYATQFHTALQSNTGVARRKFELGFLLCDSSASVQPCLHSRHLVCPHFACQDSGVVSGQSPGLESENASLSLSPQGDLQVHDNIFSPQLMWTSNTAQVRKVIILEPNFTQIDDVSLQRLMH